MTIMIYKTIRGTYFTYYIFIPSFSVVCEYLSIHPNINYLPSKSIAPFICSAMFGKNIKILRKWAKLTMPEEKAFTLQW